MQVLYLKSLNNIMSIYYCEGCNKVTERNSNKKEYKSYCEISGKDIMMKKVELNSKAQVSWTDKLVLEFAKIAAGGSYNEYAGLKSIKSKIAKFKELNCIK